MLSRYDFSDRELADNPYRLGFVQGQLFKKQIKDYALAFESYCRLIGNLFPFGSRKLASIFSYRRLFYLTKKFERFIDEDFKAEMHGIADGAGVQYSIIRVLNTLDDINNVFLCSATAFFDTETNAYVYAANLDYSLFTQLMAETVCIIKKRKSIGIGFPGYIGALRSVNCNKTVLISLTNHSKERRVAIPNGLLYRSTIDDEFKNIFGAINKICLANRGSGNNVLIGNERHVRVLELTPDEYDLRAPTDVNSPLFTTNHYLSPPMVKHQAERKPKYPPDIPESYFTVKWSEERLACTQDWAGKIYPQIFSNTLATTAQLLVDQFGHSFPLANQATICTTVFDLARRRLHMYVPKTKEELIVPIEFS
jgi:hypothetical protein